MPPTASISAERGFRTQTPPRSPPEGACVQGRQHSGGGSLHGREEVPIVTCSSSFLSHLPSAWNCSVFSETTSTVPPAAFCIEKLLLHVWVLKSRLQNEAAGKNSPVTPSGRVGLERQGHRGAGRRMASAGPADSRHAANSSLSRSKSESRVRCFCFKKNLCTCAWWQASQFTASFQPPLSSACFRAGDSKWTPVLL